MSHQGSIEKCYDKFAAVFSIHLGNPSCLLGKGVHQELVKSAFTLSTYT